MNDVNTGNEQGTHAEPIALLDCGQASKVTKGMPFLVFWELCAPPFDTTLLPG